MMKPRARLRLFATLVLSGLLIIGSPGAGGQGVASPAPAAGTCGGTYAAPNPTKAEGTLTGRVTDLKTGAGLIATLLLVSQSSVWSGTTNHTGQFTVHLPPGIYTATIRKAEFGDATRRVVIRAGRTTPLNVRLRPIEVARTQTRPSGSSVGGSARSSAAQPNCAPAASSPGRPSASGASVGSGGAPSSSGAAGAEPGGLPSAPGAAGSGGAGNPAAPSGGGPNAAPPPGPPPGPTLPPVPKFELLRTVYTPHGMAGWLAWSDDGKSIFLANEESAMMSAVKLDVADLDKPRIVAKYGEVNFLWSVAERNGLLVFHPSLGDHLIRINPLSFARVWTKSVGPSHAVETDGSRIFLPVEGKPGVLVVLDASGSQVARVSQPDGWWNIYSIIFDEQTRRLYVGAGEKQDEGFLGGIYIYDASAAPRFLGKIAVPGWEIAARGTKVWRQYGERLEAWDATNPANPTLLGSWVGQTVKHPRAGDIKPQLGNMKVNRIGNRLYVAYNYGKHVLDYFAGFMIFDVSGDAPRFLVRQDWGLPTGYWLQPTAVALSPDETTLAVSYFNFGTRIYGVQHDRVISRGMTTTAGEARDAFIDNMGFLHVFATDTIQTYNPNGEHVGALVTATRWDGGWVPFKDDTVLLPGTANDPYVLRMRDGKATVVTRLGDPAASPAYGYVFNDPILYSASHWGSRLSIHRVGQFDGRTYPMSLVGSVATPKADRSPSGGKIIAITKYANFVWGVGPDTGVVVIDVSAPSTPRLVFHDPFTFLAHGDHLAIIVARNNVYVGAGDAGLIVYDPATFRRKGVVRGLNVNFLDKVDDDLLLVASYWYPPSPSEWGLHIYDIRVAPDAPILLEKLTWGANFRVRASGHRIYRVPLYGVDILEIR